MLQLPQRSNDSQTVAPMLCGKNHHNYNEKRITVEELQLEYVFTLKTKWTSSDAHLHLSFFHVNILK